MFILYMLAIVVFYFFKRHGDRGDMTPSGPVQFFRWSHNAIGTFPSVLSLPRTSSPDGRLTCLIVQNFRLRLHVRAESLPLLQRAAVEHPGAHELRHWHLDRIGDRDLRDHCSGGCTYSLHHLFRETCLTCARSIPTLQYLTFGSNVASNILVNYPHSSLFVAIGRLGIVIMVSFSYPLQVHPCRAALDKVIAALTSSEDDEELEGRDGEDASGIVVRKAKEMSRTMFLSLTSAIVILGLIVALLVDELETGKCRPPSPAYSIQVN